MTFDACTLPTAERPLRRAEFDALFRDALQEVRRLSPRHLRLHLRGEGDLEARVRDLTDRERECCSFFTFTIEAPAPGDVVLDIDVPATRAAVLSGLADRAVRART
jgi:hypothetical protein